MNPPPLLEVSKLQTQIRSRKGVIHAVRGIDLSISKGECLGIVGESGCGKSVSMLSLLGLMPANCASQAERLTFAGEEHSLNSLASYRGKRISYIFQDPMSSLNPTMKVGWQVAEPLIVHKHLDRKSAWKQAIHLLQQVGIKDAASKAHSYPFQFSGGMLQRVAIAMAIACEPDLLIADEPTTALDVTLQLQVLSLLAELQQTMGLAVILISHDLGVVTHVADRVCIMYAGEIVESGDCKQVFEHPAHPYTHALKQALPAGNKNIPLKNIPGQPPTLTTAPTACSFQERCAQTMHICTRQRPSFHGEIQQRSRCWLYHPDYQAGKENPGGKHA